MSFLHTFGNSASPFQKKDQDSHGKQQELCTRRWRWACGDTGCDRHAPSAQGPQSWDEHAAVHHENGSLELSVAQAPKLPISSLAKWSCERKSVTSKCSLFAQLEHRCRVQGAAKDTLIQRSKPEYAGTLTTSCNTWCESADSGALPVVKMDIAASIEISWFSNMKPSDASSLPQWPWTWDLQGGLLPAALGSTLCSSTCLFKTRTWSRSLKSLA